MDDSFVSLFDEVLVGFLDKFTVVKKLADDFDASLQPTRLGSAMPTILNGHYGNNLFDALVALRPPAVAPENVHLEVALAAQRLAQQDTIDIITHVTRTPSTRTTTCKRRTIGRWPSWSAGQHWTALFRSTLSSPPMLLLLTCRLVTWRTRA